MKIIKVMIFLGAVCSIVGMAFFQLFLLLFNPQPTKHAFHQHNKRQGGFTPS